MDKGDYVMKTKILIAMLALSVAGIASAATTTSKTSSGKYSDKVTGGTTVTLNTNASMAQYACANDSCTSVSVSPNKIESNGLAFVVSCTNTPGVTSAPTDMSVTYNYNLATCAISNLSGNIAVQDAGNGNGKTSKGSLAVLSCISPDSASSSNPPTLIVNSITCPTSGSQLATTTKVSAANSQNSGGSITFTS